MKFEKIKNNINNEKYLDEKKEKLIGSDREKFQ